jgi:catechol 2,3-dioxygenase-like lactoylglutathione lyase family enzyme
MGVLRFNHIGHCVRDLAVARRFYEELLGFEKVFELEMEGEPSASLLRLSSDLKFQAVYLRREGFVLELLHFDTPEAEPVRARTMNEPGLTHLSFTVEDIDEMIRLLPEYGATVLPETRLDGAIMIQDPDGQLLELLGPEAKLMEAIWGPTPG